MRGKVVGIQKVVIWIKEVVLGEIVLNVRFGSAGRTAAYGQFRDKPAGARRCRLG